MWSTTISLLLLISLRTIVFFPVPGVGSQPSRNKDYINSFHIYSEPFCHQCPNTVTPNCELTSHVLIPYFFPPVFHFTWEKIFKKRVWFQLMDLGFLPSVTFTETVTEWFLFLVSWPRRKCCRFLKCRYFLLYCMEKLTVNCELSSSKSLKHAEVVKVLRICSVFKI